MLFCLGSQWLLSLCPSWSALLGWVLPVFHLIEFPIYISINSVWFSCWDALGDWHHVSCVFAQPWKYTMCLRNNRWESTRCHVIIETSQMASSLQRGSQGGWCLLLAILRSSWVIGMSFSPRKTLAATCVFSPLGLHQVQWDSALQAAWSLSAAWLQLSPFPSSRAEGKVKSSIIFLYSPLVYHCLIVSLNLIKFWGESLPRWGANRAEWVQERRSVSPGEWLSRKTPTADSYYHFTGVLHHLPTVASNLML